MLVCLYFVGHFHEHFIWGYSIKTFPQGTPNLTMGGGANFHPNQKKSDAPFTAILNNSTPHNQSKIPKVLPIVLKVRILMLLKG